MVGLIGFLKVNFFDAITPFGLTVSFLKENQDSFLHLCQGQFELLFIARLKLRKKKCCLEKYTHC